MLPKISNILNWISNLSKMAPVIAGLSVITIYNSVDSINLTNKLEIADSSIVKLEREIAYVKSKPDTCTHTIYLTEKRDSLVLITTFKDSTLYHTLEIPYNYPSTDSLLFSPAFVSLRDATATFKIQSTRGITFVNTQAGKVILPIIVKGDIEIGVRPIDSVK